MRLTKPGIAAAMRSAIRGVGKVEAPEAVVAAKNKSLGPRKYENIFGDFIETDQSPSPPEIHPLIVSQQQDRNPYLYYMTDKMAEGIATAFEEWQQNVRIRGSVSIWDSVTENWNKGIIEEAVSGLLFDEVIPSPTTKSYQTQDDANQRSKTMNIGLPDFAPPLDIEQEILFGIASSVLKSAGNEVINLSSFISDSPLGQNIKSGLESGSGGSVEQAARNLEQLLGDVGGLEGITDLSNLGELEGLPELPNVDDILSGDLSSAQEFLNDPLVSGFLDSPLADMAATAAIGPAGPAVLGGVRGFKDGGLEGAALGAASSSIPGGQLTSGVSSELAGGIAGSFIDGGGGLPPESGFPSGLPLIPE